jgi:hypothetical protein
VIANAFFCLGAFGVVTAVLCVVGALIIYFTQGEQAALFFIETSIVKFNGILVGATGYGLLAFVHSSGKRMLSVLLNVVSIPDGYATGLAARVVRVTSWIWVLLLAVPMTIIGGTVLWRAGFPLRGFARIYLATATISIYFVASSILAFYVYIILLFRYLEQYSVTGVQPRFQLKCSFASMDLQTIDSFFVISSTIGVAAIYFGFRGTLTANFVGTTELFRKLMVLPLVFYLPATLCYSLYPRYVLRQISECDTLQIVEAFELQAAGHELKDFKTNLELRKLILDIKEKMINDRRAVPLLSLKDAPSLTMSILIVIQLLAQKDSVVANFLQSVFK